MNENSSKSHLVNIIKMYRKEEGKLHINYLKFVDMAGSERNSKTGLIGAGSIM